MGQVSLTVLHAFPRFKYLGRIFFMFDTTLTGIDDFVAKI